jgi:pyruvate,water dikinase
MAVVVQKMLFPQAAGISFTADPVTANRKVASIEAVFGLGEALVSGRVNADAYKVRDGKVIEKTIASKQLATWASEKGGTQQRPLEPERQNQQVLTDTQIVRLARLGRQIEAHSTDDDGPNEALGTVLVPVDRRATHVCGGGQVVRGCHEAAGFASQP